MSGVLFDRQHVADVEPLIGGVIRNHDAVTLLSFWRQRNAEFPFVIAAGALHHHTGCVGGMARDWKDAAELVRYAVHRIDDVAAGFSSAWFLFLTDEHKESAK